MRNFLSSGYSEPEYQEDHFRKTYIAYRKRGFPHRKALQKAEEKTETDLIVSFSSSTIHRKKKVI